MRRSRRLLGRRTAVGAGGALAGVLALASTAWACTWVAAETVADPVVVSTNSALPAAATTIHASATGVSSSGVSAVNWRLALVNAVTDNVSMLNQVQDTPKYCSTFPSCGPTTFIPGVPHTCGVPVSSDPSPEPWSGLSGYYHAPPTALSPTSWSASMNGPLNNIIWIPAGPTPPVPMVSDATWNIAGSGIPAGLYNICFQDGAYATIPTTILITNPPL